MAHFKSKNIYKYYCDARDLTVDHKQDKNNNSECD